jgi:hypothetical protein
MKKALVRGKTKSLRIGGNHVTTKTAVTEVSGRQSDGLAVEREDFCGLSGFPALTR